MRRNKPSKDAANLLRDYPLMLIEWEDSTRLSDGWLPMQQVEGPAPHRCVSVGFLIKQSDTAKILAPSMGDITSGDNRQTYGGIMIPIRSIVRERRLR